MTLKNYIENLNEFLQKNPETENMLVISSKDDEGNGFNIIHYTPSKGIFDNNEFTSLDQLEEDNVDISRINSVCVN